MKNFKSIRKIASGTIVLSLLAAFSFSAMAFTVGPAQQIEVRGPVKEITEDMLSIDNQIAGGFQGDFIIHIAEDQQIIDSASGMSVDYMSIKNGDIISAMVGPAVTASIPPQASASAIYLEHETGWVLEGGEAGTDTAIWKHYAQDGQLSRGWLLDEGKWYYLDPESGVMQRGFIQIDGKTYYLQEDGSMLTVPKLFTPDENGALKEA